MEAASGVGNWRLVLRHKGCRCGKARENNERKEVKTRSLGKTMEINEKREEYQ